MSSGRVSDPDPHGSALFWKLDPDPDLHSSEAGSGSAKIKIQELSRLKMEPWRVVGAQNRGVEAHGGLKSLPASGRRFAPHWSVNWTRIRIKVKSWIRMRIRNPAM
jgi:hypothetical protein